MQAVSSKQLRHVLGFSFSSKSALAGLPCQCHPSPLHVRAARLTSRVTLHSRASVAAGEGILVVEIGSYLAVPLAGRHLLSLGAHVVAIERPLSSRGAAEEAAWRPETTEALLTGKQQRAIDLKSEQGRAEARQLISVAHVLLMGFRPGVAERLGVDAASCHKINPALIHVSMPGFASSDGAMAALDAFEPVILARSGIFRSMGACATCSIS